MHRHIPVNDLISPQHSFFHRIWRYRKWSTKKLSVSSRTFRESMVGWESGGLSPHLFTNTYNVYFLPQMVLLSQIYTVNLLRGSFWDWEMSHGSVIRVEMPTRSWEWSMYMSNLLLLLSLFSSSCKKEGVRPHPPEASYSSQDLLSFYLQIPGIERGQVSFPCYLEDTQKREAVMCKESLQANWLFT